MMPVFFKRLLLGVAGLIVLVVAGILAMIRPDVPVEVLKPKYASVASRFFSFDGMQVHYRDEGTGPAVLLVHGTFASLHTYEPWVATMRDSLRIITLDLPGFGLTGPQPDDDYSLAATLWLLDSLRTHLQIDSWAVGGNSLGGRLAWEYAVHFPEKTTRVLLIDGAGTPNRIPQSPDSARRAPSRNRALVFRLAGTPVVQHLLTVCTPRFWYKATLQQVFGDPTRITPELVDRYYELLRRQGNRRAFLKRGQASDQRRPQVPTLPERVNADNLHRPVLLLWGEKDRWIPVANGRRFEQAVPGSRLIVYPDAGHVPMEEIPDVTGRDARAFLLGRL